MKNNKLKWKDMPSKYKILAGFGIVAGIIILAVILLGVFAYFGVVTPTNNSDTTNQNSDSSNNAPIVSNTPQTYCGDGACNANEDCSTCSSDCGKCKSDILDNIKKTIVWVKYDVTGKNVDGSYFESGDTGSGVIMINTDNELTIYTNRHVVDC